jgi:hypothetical protein
MQKFRFYVDAVYKNDNNQWVDIYSASRVYPASIGLKLIDAKIE